MTGPAAYGDAVFTRHDDGSVTCDRADPRIRISDVLLNQVADGEGSLEATLTLPNGDAACSCLSRPDELIGTILRINCANRQLVYRITGFEHVWLQNGKWNGSYLAEWPD
jgi:hypothetical protein